MLLYVENMTRERSQCNVVSDLRDCSNEADRIINEDRNRYIDGSSKLNLLFDTVKQSIKQIRECSSISELQNLLPIKSFFGKKGEKNSGTIVAKNEKENIHPEIVNKNAEAIISSQFNSESNEKPVLNQLMPNSSPFVSVSNTSKAQDLVETPNLDKTFTKTINKKLKRKSSTSESKLPGKKKKIEAEKSTSPTKKSAQPRQPLVYKNVMKIAAAVSAEKPKMSPVIAPPLIQKKPIISKEKILLEEIKKKDAKAKENIKKVLTERQIKAELNKKAREEKRQKTLQKQREMEKEKERKKAEIEAQKSQVKPTKENNAVAKKTRIQDMVNQHGASTNGISVASEHKKTYNIPKTPARELLPSDDDNYELTPVQNSSTYNSDDDDDEKRAGKHIPEWAKGQQLRSALIQQYYNPPDLNELFGCKVEHPDLAVIFGVAKKRYLKRTSSAVWKSPPS